MITVECIIRAVDEKNPQTVNVMIEEKRGETWSRKESFDVTTGTKEAVRKILLTENERVVVTELAEPQVGFDREQMAAKSTQVLKVDNTPDASRDDSGLPESKFELSASKLEMKSSKDVKK